MSQIFELTVPWWELMGRGAIVYFFLLLLLRLTGRRQIGELSPFDFVLLLILSESVQNSMTGGDESVAGGLISATTIVGLNALVGYATFKSKKIEDLVEGKPEVIIHNGKIFQEVLERHRITKDELGEALRLTGCGAADEVQLAILETNGEISVVQRKKKD
jgi:uncharacterized membrane protein YcaP (DUF421 family)